MANLPSNWMREMRRVTRDERLFTIVQESTNFKALKVNIES